MSGRSGAPTGVLIQAGPLARFNALVTALSDSRCKTVSFGLSLLLSVIALYLIDPGLYLRIMRVWVPEASPTPFIDTAYVLGQLDCWRRGADIFVTNSCDILGRTMGYPPLWLHLWFLPSNASAAMPFGPLLGVGFIVSLAVLPPITRTRDLLLYWAAVASSATAFGVERGNVDLLIFIMATLFVVTAGKRLPVRVAGYAIIVAAALLKLYPVVLLALLMRERRRVAIAVALTALAIGAASIWLWQSQWTAMLPNIPAYLYSSAGPGGAKLPQGLFIIADRMAQWGWLAPGARLSDVVPRGTIIVAGFSGFLLASGFVAARVAGDAKFAGVMDALGSRQRECLIVGALLFCGCFVAGTSIAYRDVLLLFAIPALLPLQYEAGLSPFVRGTAWVAIALMWSLFPSNMVDRAFGGLTDDGGAIPTFAFWLAREIAWWWLFIVLSAALLYVAGLVTPLVAVPAEREAVPPTDRSGGHSAAS